MPPLRERIPIYTAGVNPRMIESAGRVADGLLGHTLFTAELHRGRWCCRRSPRAPTTPAASPHDVAIAAWCSPPSDDDADQARREAAAQIAFYASAKTYAPLLERLRFRRRGRGDPEAPSPPRLGGDGRRRLRARWSTRSPSPARPAEVRDRARRYEGMLDHVILYVPSYGISPERAVDNASTLVRAMGER